MNNLDPETLDKILLKQKKIMFTIWMGTIPNKREAKKTYKKFKLYRESWYLQNPDWFHVEFNKSMCEWLVKTHYPEHFEMYRNYSWEICRADAARYMILDRYKNCVYHDMDYYCNKPFDDALSKFPYFLALVQTPNRMIGQDDIHVSNSLMMSFGETKFWRQVLLEMEFAKSVPYFYPRHLKIMKMTGPLMLNSVYQKYKEKYGVKFLPAEKFHPYGIGDEKMSLQNNDNVYCIHLGSSTWLKADSKVIIFFYENWKIVLCIILIMLVPIFSGLIWI